MRSLILAAALATVAASAGRVSAEPLLLEKFSSLDAWKSSTDAKYEGTFELKNGALTVSMRLAACRWG